MNQSQYLFLIISNKENIQTTKKKYTLYKV